MEGTFLGKPRDLGYAKRVFKKKLISLWPTTAARTAAMILGGVAVVGALVVAGGHGAWTGLVAARLAQGKKPRLEDFIVEGQWHAALVSAVVCAVLALTVSWWLPVVAAVARCRPAPERPWRRWFWVGLAAVVVAGGVVRLPRLSHSLYNDETYTFRRYVAGDHKRQPDGTREWRPVSWQVTLWGNQMANNGVPYSLAARAAYDFAVSRGWVRAMLPAEVPLRLPALLAGLGSLVVMALLARRWGGAWAGMTAATVAAVHPWHVRYSTEARSHSLVLLLAPLLPLVLDRAVACGRLRWWAAFAATEVMLLWAFAGSLYFLVAFNGLALVWLWRRGGGVWRTFLAVHLVAAAVYCHLMAPCLPQMRQAIRDNPVFSAGISWEWALTTGSFLLTGMPWLNGNPEMASHPSLQRVWVEFPAAVMLLLLSAAALVGAGVRRVWSDLSGRVLAFSLPLAAVLAVTATMASGTLLISWYMLYLLPAGLVLAAVGSVALVQAARRRGGFAARAALSVVVLAWLGWATVIASPLLTYRQMGKQALREVARFLAVPVNGVPPLAVTHRTEAIVYDPSLYSLEMDLVDLRRLLARSDAEGRPLLVAFGYRDLILHETPEFLQAIEESGDFERVAHFPGLEEPQFAQHIWRHRPRPPSQP